MDLAQIIDGPKFEPWAEEAFDQIDAGLFSGDAFHSPEAIQRFRAFMARWERRLRLVEENLNG